MAGFFGLLVDFQVESVDFLKTGRKNNMPL